MPTQEESQMSTHNRGRGRIVGVGVGPGDPSLVTLKALDVLRAADRIVAPSVGPDDEGRAESIVASLLPGASIDRAPFEMTPGGGPTEDAIAALAGWLAQGEVIAYVTLGDPNCYSTFWSLLHRLRAGGSDPEVEIVPGIMAFQELAARALRPVVEGSQPLRLVVGLEGAGDLKEALADSKSAVVVYKGGRHLTEIIEALSEAGRDRDAVVGELVGLEGERIAPAAKWSGPHASYLATVVVGSPPQEDVK